jgi:hypothetical protein
MKHETRGMVFQDTKIFSTVGFLFGTTRVNIPEKPPMAQSLASP